MTGTNEVAQQSRKHSELVAYPRDGQDRKFGHGYKRRQPSVIHGRQTQGVDVHLAIRTHAGAPFLNPVTHPSIGSQGRWGRSADELRPRIVANPSGTYEMRG
nr:hypothetical protein Itr_chr06CG15300 [Ipomoea trifida]